MQKEGTIRLCGKTYDYRIRIEDERVESMTPRGRLGELNLSLDGVRKMYFGNGAVRVWPRTIEEMCILSYILQAYDENPDNPDIPTEIHVEERKEDQP